MSIDFMTPKTSVKLNAIIYNNQNKIWIVNMEAEGLNCCFNIL